MNKQWRPEEEEERAGTEMEITAYGIPLTPVTSFKYLGRVLLEAKNNWPEVSGSLQRARKKWERQSRMLSREGADAWTLGRIYVEVAHAIMIYGTDKWVMTICIGWVLGRFHHKVARRMMGRQDSRRQDGGWMYPLLENVMTEVGLLEVETYIYHRYNTVVQFFLRPGSL